LVTTFGQNIICTRVQNFGRFTREKFYTLIRIFRVKIHFSTRILIFRAKILIFRAKIAFFLVKLLFSEFSPKVGSKCCFLDNVHFRTKNFQKKTYFLPILSDFLIGNLLRLLNIRNLYFGSHFYLKRFHDFFRRRALFWKYEKI